jgi:hypothetical protein
MAEQDRLLYWAVVVLRRARLSHFPEISLLFLIKKKGVPVPQPALYAIANLERQEKQLCLPHLQSP